MLSPMGDFGRRPRTGPVHYIQPGYNEQSTWIWTFTVARQGTRNGVTWKDGILNIENNV